MGLTKGAFLYTSVVFYGNLKLKLCTLLIFSLILVTINLNMNRKAILCTEKRIRQSPLPQKTKLTS